jgi:hypothetical protein
MKFLGYLAAIWDQWGPRYGSQCHLHVRLGPMDDRCPTHLLLHSGVAPAYPCGVPVWWVADCCHAAWADEPYFARVCSTLFTYVVYVLLQTCPALTSTWRYRLHQRFCLSHAIQGGATRLSHTRQSGVTQWSRHTCHLHRKSCSSRAIQSSTTSAKQQDAVTV